MEKNEFYKQCGEILGIDNEVVVPYYGFNRPNRWNNRKPGNGRFEGFGLVRVHGKGHIHIIFHEPYNLNTIVKSFDEALDILRNLNEKEVQSR